MTFDPKPAVRKSIPLLLGVAGGTGSGKTYSALRLARGIAPEGPIVVIDTENGRALHYADDFSFLHDTLEAPFKPSRYGEAIKVSEARGAAVIVVDSTSHSWTGEGGVLEWHDRLEGGDARKKMLAWQEPKADHRVFENVLLHTRAHVILCFRAAPKVEMRRKADGSMEVVPKERIAGGSLDGWIPESDPRLPYELTASFLLMADRPGIPKPIKLPERLRDLVPLDRELSEETGAALAEWARGGSTRSAGTDPIRNTPTETDSVPADVLSALTQLSARLIEAQTITLAQLWASVAKMRGVSAADLADELGAFSDDGGLMLAPLLSRLSGAEADDLLERLSAYEQGAAVS